MGKAGAEQLPAMKALVELGPVEASTTAAQAEAAKEYALQVALLNQQKTILWNTVVTALLPSMESFITALTDAAQRDGFARGQGEGARRGRLDHGLGGRGGDGRGAHDRRPQDHPHDSRRDHGEFQGSPGGFGIAAEARGDYRLLPDAGRADEGRWRRGLQGIARRPGEADDRARTRKWPRSGTRTRPRSPGRCERDRAQKARRGRVQGHGGRSLRQPRSRRRISTPPAGRRPERTPPLYAAYVKAQQDALNKTMAEGIASAAAFARPGARAQHGQLSGLLRAARSARTQGRRAQNLHHSSLDGGGAKKRQLGRQPRGQIHGDGETRHPAGRPEQSARGRGRGSARKRFWTTPTPGANTPSSATPWSSKC